MPCPSFIRQRHSYSRLLVTRELFEKMMSVFHVLPRFREFVLLFGAKHGENETGPPPLRFRRLVAAKDENYLDFGIASAPVVLSKTDECLDCAYGLRYVELKHRESETPWSVRQMAIYHKFRSKCKSSTWIMISASQKTELCLDRYVRSCTDLASLNPFEIHLIILDTALANWRPYIVDLTERITEQVCLVLLRV